MLVAQHPRQSRSLRRNGFTLIEILIVVVILGVLAGIVIASFSATPHDTRASATRTSLKVIRSQLELYSYNNGPPASLQELYDEGYLVNPPVAPEGFVYQYDVDTGTVWVECTPDNNHCPSSVDLW